jgi:DNA-binding response OmpR family regulator
MPKILLVDDDRDLVGILRYAFQKDGYTVVAAYDGEAGLRAIKAEAPDIVLLDLMMPHASGMEVLEGLRRFKKVPVIVLTALGDEDNVVSALELGADDYVVKPFRPRELKARVQALARRGQSKADGNEALSVPLVHGGVRLDPRSHEVAVDARPVPLTRTEFALLQYLMTNHDTVIRVPEIVDNVWGYEGEESDEVVKVTILRLRRKLEPDPANPRYIINVPGMGYKFQS